MDNLNCKI